MQDRNIQILIADDDPDILFATSRIIKAEGYHVVTASTGEECMESARHNQPDLILLDVILPDIEGVELCKAIKSDPSLKHIYIILISGLRTGSAEQAEGLDDGADGYIARPISNRELKARVNAMVRILTAERERDRLIVELREALAKVKQLSGMLPICSYCKKIRDDEGYWEKIESYIQMHSNAELSHGICPACAKKYFPDMDLYGD